MVRHNMWTWQLLEVLFSHIPGQDHPDPDAPPSTPGLPASFSSSFSRKMTCTIKVTRGFSMYIYDKKPGLVRGVESLVSSHGAWGCVLLTWKAKKNAVTMCRVKADVVPGSSDNIILHPLKPSLLRGALPN